MQGGSNRRLANIKTRNETGLDYVMLNMNIISPFGKKKLKELRPFFPGEEEELRAELNRIEDMIAFINEYPLLKDKIQEVFMEVKDSVNTIVRSQHNTLSVVEIYEVKSLLLQMRQLLKLTKDKEVGDYRGGCCVAEIKAEAQTEEDIEQDSENNEKSLRKKGDFEPDIPEEYYLEDTEKLLDVLDPRKDRMNTFYIYDEFSEKLGEYRKKKRRYELDIRKAQKKARETLRREHGVQLTPKFDIVVARSHQDFEKIQNLEELEVVDQDYMSVTFKLKPNEEVFQYAEEMENLNTLIEAEEERITETLSKEIAEFKDVLM